MTNHWQPSWFRIACAAVLLATSLAGCGYRQEVHPNPYGGACTEPIYWEHPFYAYNATCWQQWPPGWVGCPNVCAEPYPGALWESLPPGAEAVPPGASQQAPPPPAVPQAMEGEQPLPLEMPGTLPAPGLPDAPGIPPSSRARPESRSAGKAPSKTDSESPLHFIGVQRSAESPDPDALAKALERPSKQRPEASMPAVPTPPSLSDVLGPEPPPTRCENSEATSSPADTLTIARLPQAVSNESRLLIQKSDNAEAESMPAPPVKPTPTRVVRVKEVAPIDPDREGPGPRSMSDIFAPEPETPARPAGWRKLSKTRDYLGKAASRR